jgi:hypothetical protein
MRHSTLSTGCQALKQGSYRRFMPFFLSRLIYYSNVNENYASATALKTTKKNPPLSRRVLNFSVYAFNFPLISPHSPSERG